jgi:hypothetical protein
VLTTDVHLLLQDYPAGQVLSEGLQNAEDVGASKFVFILDLRRHSSQGLDERLHRFAGPAFVLADNGSGFAKRDWKSLQNLHNSEKQDSPSEIGSFGMGTRSYFHYTDVIFVGSGKTYVGIDPLRLVSDDPGWMLDIESEVDEANNKGLGMFEVPHHDFRVEGSVIRLPFRLEKNVFGTKVTEERAREMLEDFAEQLAGGELLLFLSNVKEIQLWLWEHAQQPTLVEKVERQDMGSIPRTAPWTRLPDWISSDSRHSFESLASQLEERLSRENSDFDEFSRAEVKITARTSGKCRQWVVAQRFDVNKQLTQLISSCKALPVVGIAVPLEGAVRGRAFCFLPIGDIFTGLPVHVNAGFKVKKDRRGIWLKDKTLSSLGLVGDQVDCAHWNHLLLTAHLPRLWAQVLEEMAEEVRMCSILDLNHTCSK